MTKTNASQSLLPKILLLGFVIFSVNVFCLAQNKADLEIKVQPASETARGGENFSYTITVNNIGSAKATDVIFIQTQEGITSFISYVPSKGNCEVDDKEGRGQRVLRCKLGDLEVGESILTLVELKIRDFGGEYESKEMEAARKSIIEAANAGIFEHLQRMTGNIETNSKASTVANINVSAEEPDENKENNNVVVRVNLLPSKNLPPRVQILSPKNEEVVTRSSKKLTKVIFTIKAFDPDGTIEKVTVNTQQFYISVEYPENKYIIDDKKYSIKEVEENKEAFQKYFGGEATKIGKDTYTFTMENPRYGFSHIFVTAVDNGKRVSSASVRLMIIGDAKVEIVSPEKEKIFTPNSTIKIETSSIINDSSLNQLRIMGTRNDYYPREWIDIPILEQVSKSGNSFKNQYIWKNVPEGEYSLEAILLNDSTPTNFSERIKVIVAEPRIIKITSLKNGQEFESGKDIEIIVEARNVKNKIVYDELELIIDGKSQRTMVPNSLCEGCFPKSYIWQSPYIEKGMHTIQIIARLKAYLDKGVILGKSDVITIKVK